MLSVYNLYGRHFIIRVPSVISPVAIAASVCVRGCVRGCVVKDVCMIVLNGEW
jgi:hypothetical protein